MARRLQAWWEGLEGRTRVLVAIPAAFVVLFLFHHAFPRLSTGDRLLYAAMEAVPVALVVAWATENELRRRREQSAGEADTDPTDGEPPAGEGVDGGRPAP